MKNLIILPGEPELKPVITGRVSISRSFSYKLNVGNYESRDFFCSHNSECDASQAESVAEASYRFCRGQVMKAVEDYLAEQDIRSEAIRRQARLAAVKTGTR